MRDELRPNREYLEELRKREIAKGTHPVWLYMMGFLKVLPYPKNNER